MYLIISKRDLNCKKITNNLYFSESLIKEEGIFFKTQKVKKARTRTFPAGFIILSYDLEDKKVFKKTQRKIFRSLGVRVLPSIYIFPYAMQETFETIDEIKKFLERFGVVYRSPVVIPINLPQLKDIIYEHHRKLAQMIILKAKKYEEEKKFSKKNFLELRADLKILKERCLWYTKRGVNLKKIYDRTYKAVLDYKHMTEEKTDLGEFFKLKQNFKRT